MRRIVVATIAAAGIAAASTAFAAAQTETGVIAQIDAKAPSITLKTGKIKTFGLDKAVDIASLTVGEKVKVTYDMVDKKPIATEVTKAK